MADVYKQSFKKNYTNNIIKSERKANKMEKKIIIVTGASRGIGKEIANKNSTKIVHTVGIILNKFSKNEKKQEKKSKTKINT